jgi:hypothetical protein
MAQVVDPKVAADAGKKGNQQQALARSISNRLLIKRQSQNAAEDAVAKTGYCFGLLGQPKPKRKKRRRKKGPIDAGESHGFGVGNNLPVTHAPYALCNLTPTNPLRRYCIAIAEWTVFENFILFLIILNSVSIMIVDFDIKCVC